MNNALIKGAYFLEESHHYHRFKGFFKKLLNAEHARIKVLFDMFMVVLVVLTVGLLLYEVKNPPTPLTIALEYMAFYIFVVEYIARIWVYSDIHTMIIQMHESAGMLEHRFRMRDAIRTVLRDKWSYITSPMAIIDLLAIMPDYRFLRFLRLFRLFRLFKLFRYVKSMNELTGVIVAKQFEFKLLALVAGFVMFTSASALYVMEGKERNLDFLDALYWSLVTISTVGYGDISPITPEGKVISMILIVVGISILAFLTSIVVSYFSERVDELRENRSYAHLERMDSYIVMCGYGRVGEVVAKMLQQSQEPFIIIENDPKRVELARQRGFKVIRENASKSFVLNNILRNGRTAKLLCLTHDDALNTFIILTARTIDPDLEIISRLEHEKNRKKLYLAGASRVFSPFETTGIMALEYVQQPIAYHALESIISGTKDTALNSVEIPSDSHFIGTPIPELNLLQHRILLLGIVRESKDGIEEGWGFGKRYFHFNPGESFILQEHDRLLLLAHKHRLERFLNIIDKSTL